MHTIVYIFKENYTIAIDQKMLQTDYIQYVQYAYKQHKSNKIAIDNNQKDLKLTTRL